MCNILYSDFTVATSVPYRWSP